MPHILQSVNEYLIEHGHKTKLFIMAESCYYTRPRHCIDVYFFRPGLFASIYNYTDTILTIDLSWGMEQTLDIADPNSLQELLDLLATCPVPI